MAHTLRDHPALTPLIARRGSWSLNQLFSDIAQTTSREVGRAWVFALAVATSLSGH